MRKPSVLVVFLTVFIDLIGFGIVLPLLPIYAQDFGAKGWMIGVIVGSYSLMQFLFAPAWGRLSDRIGRRPVLLVSTAGAAISYALFAVGSGLAGYTALLVLLVSRAFAGICGANITVAQAYIADITPREERSKKMGLIGMAFGLGFIFGPALGALSLSGIHIGPLHIPGLGKQGPGWVAMSLCAANFILALTILTESWRPTSEHVAARPRLAQWLHTFDHPKIGLLVVIFFLATFCFTCFEITLGLLVAKNFHLDVHNPQDAKIVGLLFAFCGIIGAVVQGGAIGKMVKRSGEARLIANSLFMVAISMAPMPFIHGGGAGPWTLLLLTLAVLSIGSSLTRPPVFGLISILTPAHEQGATIGLAQSAGSLARIIGPIFAAGLFQHHTALPYLICSGISLCAAFLVIQRLCGESQPSQLAQKEEVRAQGSEGIS
jgi:MFS transporter, DHA1 family, tetracycline resistance protein